MFVESFVRVYEREEEESGEEKTIKYVDLSYSHKKLQNRLKVSEKGIGPVRMKLRNPFSKRLKSRKLIKINSTTIIAS